MEGYSDINILSLPNEVLALIIEKVEYKESNWLSIRLTSKKFLQISKKTQDPSIKNNEAIYNACKNGYIDYVKELLNDERVDPNGSISREGTPLSVAIRFGHYHITKLLLDNIKVDGQAKDNIAIRTAMVYNNIDIFKLLIESKKTDPSVHNDQPIIYCANKNYYNLVRELLKDERVFNFSRAMSAFIETCKNQYIETFDIFIEYPKLNAGFNNNQAIIETCSNGNIYMTQKLLNRNDVDPSARNNLCLKICCQKGNKEILKLLLNDERIKKTEVNVFDHIIRIASLQGNTEIVKILLEDPRFESIPDIEYVYYVISTKNFDDIRDLLDNDPRFINHRKRKIELGETEGLIKKRNI